MNPAEKNFPALHCMLIDDERHAIQVLENYIRQPPDVELAGTYTDPETALAAARDLPPDIAFVDVDMPRMNGLTLAPLLPYTIIVVFTTSYREYAADAYDQAAADYLLKPITYERFLRCISQIRERLPVNTVPTTLFVRDVKQEQTVAVALDELIYVSAALNNLNLHLQGRQLTIHAGLSKFAEQLPAHFCRIHRSYIVNLWQVDIVRSDLLTMKDGTILPIGRNYLKALRRSLHR